MNQPLVSIITPTYNHEQYISDCIRSAQEQTFTDWEMIIVDDGSTDTTYAVAKKLAEQDERIKVFTQKNVGIFRLSETYNFALAQSRGKYIAVLEGDDVWLPNKLELQVVGLEGDDDLVLSYGMAYSSSSDLSEDYSLSDLSHFSTSTLANTPIGVATEVLIFKNFLVALTVVIRKEALITIGGFKQSHGLPLVDVTTWIELSLLGKFLVISQPLGKWRFYPNQITKTYTAEISQGFYDFALDFYQRNSDFFESRHFSSEKIHTHFKIQLIEAHSRSGRYKLIRKDFKGARKNYRKSIFCFGFQNTIWKLRSVIGFVFSLFHLDVEGLSKILGKRSYK